MYRANRSMSSTSTEPRLGDGSFASNCLLARRLAERGVRFIQLYHRGWDHHGGVKNGVGDHKQAGRSRQLGADRGFQATRHAQGHVGGVGRRVWPHTRCPRAGATILVATITSKASRSGWREAESAAALPTERPTSLATTRSKTSSPYTTSTRPCCTCWESITSDSLTSSRGSTCD